MEKFNAIEFIKKLISFGERQGESETKAAKYIIEVLNQYGIEYFLHEFKTVIPLIKKSCVLADSKLIPSKGTSFTSGKINEKDSIVSSLVPSKFLFEYSNFNFNPKCEIISQSNFYFAPSFAISKNDLNIVLNSKNVSAEIVVEKKEHVSLNILVGNIKNPDSIIFAHYDSISLGATDNASGVAVLMDTIISNPELLVKNLFVFSGNEELSYDKPTYWGHGFREFEKDYLEILDKAKSIIVVDCVGNGRTILENDDVAGNLSFPIANAALYNKKLFVMYGDIEKLFEVYHSDGDDLLEIDDKYLLEASILLQKELKKRI
ncbi:MAG: M28 family peptidase [Candidatus Pacebacteria bacterium]|nr:M28 family peptidase [Candidatus Paceibacterota bacterium]